MDNNQPPAAEDPQVVVNMNFFRAVDEETRLRQEATVHQAIETKLIGLSRFTYSPKLYNHLLEPAPWPPKPLTDFSHLIESARERAGEGYAVPIVIKAVLALLVVCGMIYFNFNVFAMTVGGALIGGIAVMAWLSLRQRETAIQVAVAAATKRVEELQEKEQAFIAQQRRQHDIAEARRVERIVGLLSGDPQLVSETLTEAIQQTAFPFVMQADAEYFNGALVLKPWFPPATLFPTMECIVRKGEPPEYRQKSDLEINKQHTELCCAIAIQLALNVFAVIPTLQEICVQGMTKYGFLGEECVLSFFINRSHIDRVLEARSARLALELLERRIVLDSNGMLRDVPPFLPAAWNEKHDAIGKIAIIKIEPHIAV